ncbi:cadherin-like beta sandwich domain-containing protein [Cohnella cholangitidis]|uniref:FecR family protein n=1 Tax=Cohnella cholangitidis TaxID=2598458 RepID=A0A7G5C3V2_9BACL|nr:cadherin-like beta sandwich domain-containing protein [Cohnella cholangitidis]QMV43886.1 hypothetical protein FPL14_23965 [Cohnella cholangitidis]
MRKTTIRLLAVLLALLPLLGVWTGTTSAASSRVAVISELKGTVKVKKAGGTKEFTAFAKMSLNEGDVLSTSKDSYAELQFANGSSQDDRMTVAENSTLTFSKLSDGKGTRTKISMLKGTTWFEVKSIKTAQDEFQLETPTAIMGVRGTKVVTIVDPITGATKTITIAGIVNVQPAGQPGPNPPSILVFPSQQISLFPPVGPAVPYLPNHPSVVQIPSAVSTTPPKIIEKIIQSASEIQEENDKLMQKLRDQLNQGIPNGLATQSGPVNTAEDLNRFLQNFDNLLGNLAKEAINQKKINDDQMRRIIEEANSKINDPAKKLDLDKTKPLDPGSGVDPELEKAKQLELQAKAKYEQEQRQLLENQQRLAALLAKIEADKKAIDEANKKAAKEAADKAAAQLKSQLDETARKAFEDRQKQNNPPTTSSSGGSSSGGGSPGGGTPGGGTPAPASKLATLSISSGTLNFDPISSVRTYSVDVSHEVSSVTISATASSGSTIRINDGAAATNSASAIIPLPNVGAHTVTVKVTEQGKQLTTYTLTVNRGAPGPITLPDGITNWKTTNSAGGDVTWKKIVLPETYEGPENRYSSYVEESITSLFLNMSFIEDVQSVSIYSVNEDTQLFNTQREPEGPAIALTNISLPLDDHELYSRFDIVYKVVSGDEDYQYHAIELIVQKGQSNAEQLTLDNIGIRYGETQILDVQQLSDSEYFALAGTEIAEYGGEIAIVPNFNKDIAMVEVIFNGSVVEYGNFGYEISLEEEDEEEEVGLEEKWFDVTIRVWDLAKEQHGSTDYKLSIWYGETIPTEFLISSFGAADQSDVPVTVASATYDPLNLYAEVAAGTTEVKLKPILALGTEVAKVEYWNDGTPLEVTRASTSDPYIIPFNGVDREVTVQLKSGDRKWQYMVTIITEINPELLNVDMINRTDGYINFLASLSPSGNHFGYTAPYNVYYFTFTPVTSHENVEVLINGESSKEIGLSLEMYPLSEGAKVFTIVVVSPSGKNSNSYTLIVNPYTV